jgi:hypothetical protein
MREDEANVELAESLGWTVDWSTRYQRGLTFRRGVTSIWQIRLRGAIGWQVADLLDGYYCNHRPQEKLETALKLEGEA